MKIRKIKKEIKKSNNVRFVRVALGDLKLVSYYARCKRPYSKRNMKICTGNFFNRGKFYGINIF